VTFYCPDSEHRTYDDAGRIKAVEYRPQAAGGNYADPAVYTPRNWRDEYQYDDDGKLAGWTRIRGEMREEFTHEGHLVVERDDRGRPAKVRQVSYQARQPKPGQAPTLQQIVADEVITIE
jgi:YD repeat-containing protein